MNRDQIVEAALEILERDGVRGFTMEALSKGLGTSKGAAYHHIDGKDALLGQAAMAVSERLVLPAPDGRRWERQLREVSIARRREFGRYPGLAAYASRHDVVSNHRFIVWFHELLGAAGFDPATCRGALALYRALMIADLDREPEPGWTALPHDSVSSGDGPAAGTWQLFAEVLQDAPDPAEALFSLGLEQLITGLRAVRPS